MLIFVRLIELIKKIFFTYFLSEKNFLVSVHRPKKFQTNLSLMQKKNYTIYLSQKTYSEIYCSWVIEHSIYISDKKTNPMIHLKCGSV